MDETLTMWPRPRAWKCGSTACMPWSADSTFVAARSAYSAAKHALDALTASLRLELREAWPAIHVTSVAPGVVATDFGLHALHGGPDSRALPFAQPVDEVAAVIADALEHPRAEVYTRPGMQQQVSDYYAAEDPAAFVARPPRGRGSPAAEGGAASR